MQIVGKYVNRCKIRYKIILVLVRYYEDSSIQNEWPEVKSVDVNVCVA